jgi:hypothetical protein
VLADGGAILLYVREPDEWQTGHAPRVRHIPLGQLSRRASGLPEHRAVVTVCRSQRVLGTPPSTGALLISRLGFAAGRPVEWRRTLIRGDRFSLLAEFSARTGCRLAPVMAEPPVGGELDPVLDTEPEQRVSPDGRGCG